MNRPLISLVLLLCCPLALVAGDTLSVSIETCQRMALDNSRNLQVQTNKTRQAEFQRREVLANFFPSAKVAATAAYTPKVDMVDMDIMMMPLSMQMQMKGLYLASIQVTQPLFAGGQIVNGYKLTKVGEKAAKEQEIMAKNKVIADVTQAYWSYVAVRSKQKMLDEYICQLDSLYGDVKASTEVGLTTQSDLLRVETARRQVQYQLQRVRSGIELCRMALSTYMDIDYDSIFLLPDAPDLNIHGTYTEYNTSVDSRPEVRLLEYQLEAARLQKKSVVGKYLPTIGLMATYAWFGNMYMYNAVDLTNMGMMPINADFNMKMQMPMVAAAVSVPLTDWGGGAYAIKRAKLEVSNAELELNNNRRLLQLEARRAVLNLSDGEDLVETARLALESATEALRVTRDRYEVGLAPVSDFLSAQADWQKAEADYIEAETQFRINEIEYLRTTGQLAY